MNYHGKSTLQPFNKRMYFLNSCQISGYFDTKFITIVQIGLILTKSKDLQKWQYFEPRTGLFSRDTCQVKKNPMYSLLNFAYSCQLSNEIKVYG